MRNLCERPWSGWRPLMRRQKKLMFEYQYGEPARAFGDKKKRGGYGEGGS